MKSTGLCVSEGWLTGTNEVYITNSLVTREEQSILLGWAEDQHRRGRLLENPRNPGAHSTPFRSADKGLTGLTNADGQRESATAKRSLVWVPNVDDQREDVPPPEFWHIRSRVVDLLGLSEFEEDHYKGSFLSYIAPGAGIHRHRDARLEIDGEERMILRCNVFLKRPRQGGLPVIESTEIDVPDRGMWVFFPTELFHSATPVGGSEFRGLLSFGFLVRPADLWQRRFRLAASFERDYGLDSTLASRQALLTQLRSGGASQGVSPIQLELIEFVLMADGGFRVLDAAQSLGRSPPETLEQLQRLQRANVVESHSSTWPARGRVMVL